MPRPIIFADHGCPFAHRVLALLTHLGVDYDLKEAPFGQAPAGIAQWSPSGRIPLLVHGELAIGESRVMLDYLAEAYPFGTAYPRELVPRTLVQHAMALTDSILVPRLMRDLPLDARRLAECLDTIEAVALKTKTSEPGLLTFHIAPMWLRFQWWRPDSAMTRAVMDRPQLAAWLDAATELAAIARTAPDRAENIAAFQQACSIGALPT